MWHLNDLERRARDYKLTEAERADTIELLKAYVARYIRMATQKNAGQRGNPNDLDTLNTLEITAMSIIICATNLCLDGYFGAMPDRIEGDMV